MRLNNLSKWQELPEGTVIPLKGGKERRVVVRVNCPAPTRFDLVEDGVLTFLGVVQGLDVIDFVACEGKVVGIAWDGEVPPWFVTEDGRDTTIRFPDEPVKFTKIATRRQRNPDLARIEDTMRLNELKRQQQWEDEVRRRRQWEASQNAGNDTLEAGAAGGGGTEEPAGAPEAPVEGEEANGAT